MKNKNVDVELQNKTTASNDVDKDNLIGKLIHLLSSVEIDNSEAKLNAISISDGKGGRILL